MNVFGVGPLELAVILIVALVFVGPDRLPRLAADLARTLREIRKYTSGLAAEFNEVIKDVEKETAGEKNVWKEVSEGIGGATQQVTEAIRGVRQDILKADTPAAAPPTQGGPLAANGAAAASDSAAAAPGWVEIPDPDAPAADAADTATKPEPERAETAP